MKIIWTENPLYSKVELDDNDREILRLNIVIESYIDHCIDIELLLKKPDKTIGIEKATSFTNGTQTTIEENGKNWAKALEMYLSGPHVGDCTCFPASCCKCIAESHLKIDTIKGLGKHQAHHILSAFGKNNEKTINEALDHLKNYTPGPKTDMWEKYSDADYDALCKRWESESHGAYKWLKKYKDEHGFN
jgi:hypothetical protein